MLPWWLKHHNAVFDHGIMIDYRSTDSSCDIIREICPDWEIRTTRNEYWRSADIDREVEDIEAEIDGWHCALNVPEFLYGNYDRMVDCADPLRFWVGNYVFVDMLTEVAEPSYDLPLHAQRRWGYQEPPVHPGWLDCGGRKNPLRRTTRSIQNYPAKYAPEGGRHWPDVPPTFSDLAIFYYAYAIQNDPMVKRRTQMQRNIPPEQNEPANYHVLTDDDFLNVLERGNRPISYYLGDRVEPFLDINRKLTGQDF